MRVVNETVNEVLRGHQLTVTGWKHSERIENLLVWIERFQRKFKLSTPQPALGIDHLRINTYGHFRLERNGFGLSYEIILNEKHLVCRPLWQSLGTLLHEMIHADMYFKGECFGKGAHGKTFRQRALQMGLVVDRWGHQTYALPPSPFFEVLTEYGVEFQDELSEAAATRSPAASMQGFSKLKLWTCGCKPNPFRVRVARRDFRARCLVCNQLFKSHNKDGQNNDCCDGVGQEMSVGDFQDTPELGKNFQTVP